MVRWSCYVWPWWLRSWPCCTESHSAHSAGDAHDVSPHFQSLVFHTDTRLRHTFLSVFHCIFKNIHGFSGIFFLSVWAKNTPHKTKQVVEAGGERSGARKWDSLQFSLEMMPIMDKAASGLICICWGESWPGNRPFKLLIKAGPGEDWQLFSLGVWLSSFTPISHCVRTCNGPKWSWVFASLWIR